MTTLLSYPMSDPFAAEAAARYANPPFSPGQGLFAPPPPPTPSYQESHSSTRPQQGDSSRKPSPNPPFHATDEFGTFGPSSTTAPTAAAARARHASASPAMTLALASAGPVASTSTARAHAHAQPHAAQAQRPRQRQSHNPSTALVNASPPKPEYLTDEYVLHPSVFAYKEAHPRRPMVGFGPYVLLQTLGEGEFGKVKLGVHTQEGFEVAIKLIRRGSLDDEARANKVEREIDVLKQLKHPNIVWMFDVIEQDKHIGIVLDFAGGGELFDHILANKYLRERDAQKLFAQLISGVDYLHKKHIVHRDLKLENLLLDKHRNIIITDFGFANRFDHEQDDLMATSCGSPCYAAPELVVSEGLYIGSAVDIWSCGVILYAMLSGYLPYDDDPSNPDGDNINLLYKYIMSTKLNFPDHISPEAKHLLQIMLVPNPEYRCRIEQIMAHPWLESQRDLFVLSVKQQEDLFLENLNRKFHTARRELASRRQLQLEAKQFKAFSRSQSSMPGTTVTASMLDQTRRSRDTRHHSAMPGTTTMPEYLSTAGHRTPPLVGRQPLALPALLPPTTQTSPILADSIVISPVAVPTSRAVTPPVVSQTPPRQRSQSMAAELTPQKPEVSGTQPPTAVEDAMDIERPSTPPPSGEPVKQPMSANKNRHTIQVEYDGEASYEKMKEDLDARQPSTAEWPRQQQAQLQVPQITSDVDMESESSDQGHTRATTLESAGDMASSEASQLLTPDATTPPVAVVLQSPHDDPRPTTPTRSKAVSPVSPTTPRASSVNLEDVTTPRGPTSEATPRASLQVRPENTNRTTSRASTSTSTSTIPAPGPGAKPSGLPKPPKRDRYRKGMSLDKFGLARLLGQAAQSTSDVSRTAPPSSSGAALRVAQNEAASQAKRASVTRPQMTEIVSEKDKKSSRRRTLQLMVNRNTASGKPMEPSTHATPAAPLTPRDANTSSLKAQATPPIVTEPSSQEPTHDRGRSTQSVVTVDALAAQETENVPKHASSNAAKKVMDWFRRKSLAKDTLVNLNTSNVQSDSTSSFVRVSDSPARDVPQITTAAMSSTSSIAPTAEGTESAQPESATLPKEQEQQRMPLSSADQKTNIAAPAQSTASLLPAKRTEIPIPSPSRSKSHRVSHPHPPSENVPLNTGTLPNKLGSRGNLASSGQRSDELKMRVHTGLVDQSALSSKPPKEVMAEVLKVLQGMGMDIKKENEFRLRCTRVRRRKAGPVTGLGLGSVMSGGSVGPFTFSSNASASRTDSRGLPLPSSPSTGILSSGGLKGMLLRRGSSYSSANPFPRSDSENFGSPSLSSIGLASPTLSSPASVVPEPLYGEHSIDAGDEVKLVIELCRIKNLPGLYLLNIKRLRGSVWSFKFIYQTVLERCETLTH